MPHTQRMVRSATRPNAAELGLWVPSSEELQALKENTESTEQDSPDPPTLVWRITEECRRLSSRYGGVILRGPPGTGKSYIAARVAEDLVGEDQDRIYRLQFHPSYQYEDFVEGYKPNDDGGFDLAPRTLRLAASQAEQDPDKLVVVVIDELSRVDCARVFGEAFTYLERSKRGIKFYLASGTPLSIPSNLFVVATMNDWDTGVDTVDAALERRFAMLEVLPSAAELVNILSTSSLSIGQRSAVVAFFREANAGPAEGIGLGHAYFYGIHDSDDLRELWDFQLRFVIRRALTLDPERFEQLEALWRRTVLSANETAPGTTVNSLTAGDTASE
jgi:5-methylcytosine-specific restriction enzyme B